MGVARRVELWSVAERHREHLLELDAGNNALDVKWSVGGDAIVVLLEGRVEVRCPDRDFETIRTFGVTTGAIVARHPTEDWLACGGVCSLLVRDLKSGLVLTSLKLEMGRHVKALAVSESHIVSAERNATGCTPSGFVSVWAWRGCETCLRCIELPGPMVTKSLAWNGSALAMLNLGRVFAVDTSDEDPAAWPAPVPYDDVDPKPCHIQIEVLNDGRILHVSPEPFNHIWVRPSLRRVRDVRRG
jgi:hypothetical protein